MTSHQKFSFDVTVEMQIVLDKDLTNTAKLLYTIITSLAKTNNTCFASNFYLAKLLNTTTRQVQRCLELLKNKGYIIVDFANKTRTITPAIQKIIELREKDTEKFKEIFEYDWLNQEDKN